MVPDRPEREGRLHDQLLELESIRSAGLLSAAEHKSKREAVISRWEESLRKREELETTLAENKAKTQQLLHALRATVKHGSDLLSKKQMAGVRQAYLELTGLSSLPSAVPKLRDLCARFVAENFVPRRGRAGPSGAKRREEDALDNDRETWGSWSLPDEPLDDLEDSGAPTPAPVTPDEVPPAPTEEEEPQEPEEKARRREWEAAKGIAAVAPVRREPLPQKRGCRRGRKNGSSLFRGVNFHKPSGRWLARVYIKRKAHFLGEYNDEEMAAEAFDKAVIKIRGKHAVTNFPAEEYAEEMRSMGASEISVEEFICELRREAKEDKLKGAKNSYNLFYDHVLDRVKEDLMADLAEGEKLTVQATTCAIAALWREQDKETKEEWQARAKELRAAVDQTPERAAVEVGPSTSRGGKAAGADGPGPSKRPRHEGEGEAAKGIAAVAPVRREPLPQKRGRRGPKNRSSIYCGVCKSRGSWEARVFIKECVACGTKTTPQWRNIESKAYCNACGLRKIKAMKSLLGPKKKRGRPKKISLPGEKLLAKAKKPAGRKRKRKPDKVVDVEDVVT